MRGRQTSHTHPVPGQRSCWLTSAPSAVCQMTAGAGRHWALWSPCRDTCGIPPRSSLATAGDCSSSGTRPHSVRTASSWGTRFVWEAGVRSPGPLLLAALLMPVCPGPQQLESLCWERSGSTLVSSHSDGSYAIWSADTGSSPVTQPTVATVPYGEC